MKNAHNKHFNSDASALARFLSFERLSQALCFCTSSALNGSAGYA